MPFYEYQCRACGRLTEVLQKVSDPPLRKCPECGKSQLQKLVSAPVFRLKGGGWYETDFKSDGENKRNLVGADKDEAPAKSADAKTEPKEGAKAETPAADKKSGGESADKPSSKTAAKTRPAPKPAARTAAKKRPAARPKRAS